LPAFQAKIGIKGFIKVMSFAQMPILAWWPAIACYQHLGYAPL